MVLRDDTRGVLSIKQMIDIVLSVSITAPLVIGTVIFVQQGEFMFAALTAALAIVAIFLPSYIMWKFDIRDLFPSFLRRSLAWIKSLKP